MAGANGHVALRSALRYYASRRNGRRRFQWLRLVIHDVAARPRRQRRQDGVRPVRQESHRAIGEEPISSTRMRAPKVVRVTAIGVVGAVILRKQPDAKDDRL